MTNSDLGLIAEDLIEDGDLESAVFVYQQLLDKEINDNGVMSEYVYLISMKISNIFIELSNFEEAQGYAEQALIIQSYLQSDIHRKFSPSLELLEKIYLSTNDSIQLLNVQSHINRISQIDSLYQANNLYAFFPLLNVPSLSNEKIDSTDNKDYRAFNLLELGKSYFDIDLYFEGVEALSNALDLESNQITLSDIRLIAQHNIEKSNIIINTIKEHISTSSDRLPSNYILLSIFYHESQEIDLAEKYAIQYADLVTDYYLAHQLLGDYEFFKQEYENALFHYERSLLINDNSMHSNYKQSICFFFLGYFNESINILTKIIAENPYHAQAFYYLGLNNKSLENHSSAIKNLTQYLLLNPDDDETYLHLGISYHKIKNNIRAVESLKRYLNYDHKSGEAHYYLARIYERTLKLERALDEYNKSIKYSPDKMDAYYRLGMIHYNNSNYKLAMNALREYAIHNPDSIGVIEILADIFYNENRFPEAINSYTQLLETDSLRVDYMLQIAKSHIELGELEQSKYFLNTILNIKTEDLDILYLLANLENELGEYKNAIDYYIQAISIGGNTLSTYYNIAIAYANDNNFLQALLAFKKALELAPDDPEITYQIAICYKQMQIYDLAIEFMMKYLRYYPGDSVGHYILGEIYLGNKQYEDARSSLLKSYELNSKDYTSLYKVGLCNYNLSEYANAALYFKKALKIEAEDTNSHFMLGIAYINLNKKREAVKQLNILYMLDRSLHDSLQVEIEKSF